MQCGVGAFDSGKDGEQVYPGRFKQGVSLNTRRRLVLCMQGEQQRGAMGRWPVSTAQLAVRFLDLLCSFQLLSLACTLTTGRAGVDSHAI